MGETVLGWRGEEVVAPAGDAQTDRVAGLLRRGPEEGVAARLDLDVVGRHEAGHEADAELTDGAELVAGLELVGIVVGAANLQEVVLDDTLVHPDAAVMAADDEALLPAVLAQVEREGDRVTFADLLGQLPGGL